MSAIKIIQPTIMGIFPPFLIDEYYYLHHHYHFTHHKENLFVDSCIYMYRNNA